MDDVKTEMETNNEKLCPVIRVTAHSISEMIKHVSLKYFAKSKRYFLRYHKQKIDVKSYSKFLSICNKTEWKFLLFHQ